MQKVKGSLITAIIVRDDRKILRGETDLVIKKIIYTSAFTLNLCYLYIIYSGEIAFFKAVLYGECFSEGLPFHKAGILRFSGDRSGKAVTLARICGLGSRPGGRVIITIDGRGGEEEVMRGEKRMRIEKKEDRRKRM
jgi:hypothetical protein